MRLLTAIAALSVVALVSAQDNTIMVGAAASAPGGPLQFIPSTINASNGSTLTFKFTGIPGNHSVTQSSFDKPCTPLSGGFDSGWVYIPPTGDSEIPQWKLTITNDSRPTWFFCKQLSTSPHCKAGMVGAINAPLSGSNTFSAFQNNAKSFSGTPGQDQGGLVGQGASAAGRPSPIPSGVTAYIGPTGTAPASTQSASASASSKPNSSSTLRVNSLVVLLAAVLGISLA